MQGKLGTALTTKRPLNHIARGIVGVCAMGLGFFALTRLPLPEAITLNYAQPLLVVVFSSIFLGEAIRVYRWSAVAVGLIGVLIISWPELTLLAARRRHRRPGGARRHRRPGLGRGSRRSPCFWCATWCDRADGDHRAVVFAHRERHGRCLSLAVRLAGADGQPGPVPGGLPASAGGLAQMLMTEAYRHAEASMVAPFEYTSMILGIVVGYLVFGDVPTLNTLVGGAIVVAAGIFIIWREQQLGLERGAGRRLTPTQG